MSFLDFFRYKKGEESTTYSDGAKDLCVYVATNRGKVRKRNEDNYFADDFGIRPKENYTAEYRIKNDKYRIFAVCDGMGGESYGDIASRISVEVMGGFSGLIRKTAPENLHQIINRYATGANNRVCDMVLEMKCNRSGSTLAMVCICGSTVHTYSIGDSRVYFFRDDTLTQITEDQTLAMKKLKANIYTAEEAIASGDMHKITSFIGVDDRRIGLKTLAYQPFELGNGRILICSDGLTDMCSDGEIKEIISAPYPNPAEMLVETALANGGMDNITCIVIESQGL